MGPKTAEAYSRLRAMVTSGELAPGAQLPSERALVYELGIGRTALRQVLARLLVEGALVVQDRKGYFVPEDGQQARADVTLRRPCLTSPHCERWGWCHRCTPKLAAGAEHVVVAMREVGVPEEVRDDVYGKIMLLLDAMTVEMLRRRPSHD